MWNHATVDSKYAVTTEIYEAMIGGRMSKKLEARVTGCCLARIWSRNADVQLKQKE